MHEGRFVAAVAACSSQNLIPWSTLVLKVMLMNLLLPLLMKLLMIVMGGMTSTNLVLAVEGKTSKTVLVWLRQSQFGTLLNDEKGGV